MRVEISEQARNDLMGIVRWYDAQQTHYGQEFLSDLQVALVAIADNPRLYARVEDGPEEPEYREYIMTRFRQRVVFLMEPERILVIAVVHTSRRPGAWFYSPYRQ